MNIPKVTSVSTGSSFDATPVGRVDSVEVTLGNGSGSFDVVKCTDNSNARVSNHGLGKPSSCFQVKLISIKSTSE